MRHEKNLGWRGFGREVISSWYDQRTVSLSRRILESAQSSLAKLTSLVIVDDEPLSNVESQMLTSELTARRKAREGGRGTHPLTALVGADPTNRAKRGKLSDERAARLGKERSEKAARDKASSDEAFRRMKEQAARSGGSSSTSSGSSGGGTSGRTAPNLGKKDSQLAEWYKVLGVNPGDDLAKIKGSYRQLMRKYHPDMHAGDPQKQKAANELSMKVTTAYNGLVSHLEGR